MIKLAYDKYLVESIDELPDFGDDLFLDFETSSGHPSKDSLNPWHNCSVAGICVKGRGTASYYVPVNHYYDRYDIHKSKVRPWLIDVLTRAKRWINHNVKYDAQVLFTDFNIDVLELDVQLVCTVVLAKLVDSDLLTYKLASLCKKWLGLNLYVYEDSLNQYVNRNNKDYGRIPADILGLYGCWDVHGNELLYDYVEKTLPEQCHEVRDTELELTKVLIRMERRGMHVNPKNLKVQEYLVSQTMLNIEWQLHETTGIAVRPHVGGDCYELLCGKYQLPVVEWTEKGEPSFNKDALKKYRGMPEAPRDIVILLLRHRELNTLRNNFIIPYQELHIDGVLHPNFNQIVRTGRMSCKNPNAQQLSTLAKGLIIPPPDHYIVSQDFSQIEFRTMVHYMNDKRAIEMYNQNPDTDFHIMVAEWCHIKRKPAKTVNFGIGFGAGLGTLLGMLSTNEDVIDEVLAETGDDPEKYKVEMEKRCKRIYNRYYKEFPNLRTVTNLASFTAKKFGYVFNHYGRHRHLPLQRAHIAFNTLNQSTAADIQKERTVALAKKFPELPLIASIHDDTLSYIHKDDLEIIPEMESILESPRKPLKVPLKVNTKKSLKSWADCS